MSNPNRKKPDSAFLKELALTCSPSQTTYFDRPKISVSYVRPQLANSAHCVWEEDNGAKIYLGNATTAAFGEVEVLLEAGIRAVVNCTPSSTNKHADHLTYCQIPVRDIETAKIAPYFPSACIFLQDQLQEKKQSVLVHCMAGVSRSATIVMAYLIQSHNMSLDAAYRHVKERRPPVQPNAGFWAQLRVWEGQTRRNGSHQQPITAVRVATQNPDWPSKSLVLFATLRNLLVDDYREICFGLGTDVPSDAVLMQALDFVWGKGVSSISLEWLVGLCQQNGGSVTAQRVVDIMEGEEFNEAFTGEMYPSWLEKVRTALVGADVGKKLVHK